MISATFYYNLRKNNDTYKSCKSLASHVVMLSDKVLILKSPNIKV